MHLTKNREDTGQSILCCSLLLHNRQQAGISIGSVSDEKSASYVALHNPASWAVNADEMQVRIRKSLLG